MTVKYPGLGKYNNARAVEFIAVIRHRSDSIKSISVVKSNCQIDSVNIIEQTYLHRSIPVGVLGFLKIYGYIRRTDYYELAY